MYIKSIVLDGFKSYGNRVEVSGFDPQFNAITGLNGTGKSNILDSICFVLGITNLSNVRAGSLQELIYKHGQAGITKATVSITFDNSDKSQCPIGYENHTEITVTRQVVMGGKNKYMINGINVQNKRVSDLFCSVQLNVNNPHFLIMQGRITKVLNMRPPEILSMVEEAAGTRMFEAKKQAAQKTIEKKDAKLRELNDIIREDIAPKLQKLQDERSQFQEYQKVNRELENLTRLAVAWRYVSAEKSSEEAEAKVKEVHDEIQTLQQTVEGNRKEAKNLDQQVAQLNRRLDEESGSSLKTLETELVTLEKTEACTSSQLKGAREALAAHEKKARLMLRSLKDDEKALQDKQNALGQVSATFSQLKEASEQSALALEAAQQRFLAVSSGLEDPTASLQDQLIAAKQEASEAETRLAQAALEMRHGAEREKQLRKEFAQGEASFAKDQAGVARLQAQADKLQAELSRMQVSDEHLSQLKAKVRSLQESARGKRDQCERLAARLARCECRYQDPEPGFDRSRVAGTVCRLIDVKDPVYCTALETAAGGRLYNVVVDTDVTSRLLLQKGQLQTRTTIIPLNKISGQVLDQRTVRLAQEIGGGPSNVQLALDLVEFPSRLRPAMAWVLGQTLVCRDLEVAKRVTFHPKVQKRSVTLDGDVFDPAGTLSGGAQLKGGSVLLQLQQLKQAERELQQTSEELASAQAELDALQRAAEAYAQKHSKFEMVSHELALVKARAAATSSAQLHQEIEALSQRGRELQEQSERDRVQQREATDRAKELESKVKDIKGHRDREYKKAEAELKRAQKEAQTHSGSWKQREQEFETLRLEVAELQAAVATSSAQLATGKQDAGALAQQLEAAAAQHAAAAEAVKEMQGHIRQKKAEISSKSTEIAKLMQRKEALDKANGDIALRVKELEYQVTELKAEAANCKKKIQALEAEHAWVAGERQFFGAPGGLYDFEARQASAAQRRLEQLKAKRDKLARGVNARAHTLLGKEEEQYQDMLSKKRIVEADRAKLVQVMAELDAKKKATLNAAVLQVDRDFGSIFSSLLPGAMARLRPPPGMDVLDGLEVKVGFNGAWKESLGELSGGQRSLVALALVLAMLLFKPAPLYILDEVDAALDLSHTQNIGQMLRDHFKHSQFVIVSLKDGMFNNANVLFRTRFVDGMSSVQRTANVRR